MTKPIQNKTNWLFGGDRSLLLTLILIFTLAAGIRLYDLTDLPLDFAPTRQLFSALKARGMYYAMQPDGTADPHAQLAIQQWKGTQVIEPTIIEGITASTYLLVGEHIWVGRVYSILFWLLGGVPLYLLAKKIAGANGAIVSLSYYFFLPYGAIASRAIQPDPLMVALIIFGVWSTYDWITEKTWKWAILAGIFNGLALLVKNVAIFPILFAILALLLANGLPFHIKDKKTWAVAILSVLPTLAYTLYGLFAAGFLGQQFAFRFFPNLWFDPVYYLRWKNQIDGVIGFAIFIIAFISVFLTSGNIKKLLLGLWAGYFAFGLTFAYHISSHDYYQLLLIPIVALSLAPLVEVLISKFAETNHVWVIRVVLGALLTTMIGLQLWAIRVDLARDDYRPETDYWAGIGNAIGQPAKVLTISQDYGYRLAYWGWQDVESWLDDADLNLRTLDGRQIDLVSKFEEKVADKDFIVVSQMSKLDEQPQIKQLIYNTYPVFAEGDGYVIFDVKNRKK